MVSPCRTSAPTCRKNALLWDYRVKYRRPRGVGREQLLGEHVDAGLLRLRIPRNLC